MYAIIGLGNPGEKYEKTRHNVGFLILDTLLKRYNGGKFSKGKGQYLQTKIIIDTTPVLLVKPLTFMNLSGHAVCQVVDYYNIDISKKLLVAVDDLNIPFGVIRIKPGGSAGGQKGLKSIIEMLNTKDFYRLRFGIGRRNGKMSGDMSSYVLSRFNKEEQKHLPELLEWAADAIEIFVSKDAETAMNKYNKDYLES